MPRRIAEIELGLCLLLMFGTASVAGDDVVFDLSHAAVQQTAAQPRFANPAENPPYAPPLESDGPRDTLEPSPSTGYPESASQGSGAPASEAPASDPRPIDEAGGYFGWQPRAPHFDLPSRSFSLFRSPASYGWSYHERCAPTPWKPRGDGIPRRTSCYRMDYAPYQLKHDASRHGPAFYMRYELYPCEECHEHAHHLQRFYGRRY